MKKVVIAAALALAATASHAWEVSGRGVYDWSGTNSSGGGVAISQGFKAPVAGDVKGSLEFTRVGESPWGVNQVAAVATKELIKLPLNVSLGARAGAGYIEPLGQHVGGAVGLLGLVASVPVTKTVAVEAGLDRRFVESKVAVPGGNVGFLGLRVGF